MPVVPGAPKSGIQLPGKNAQVHVNRNLFNDMTSLR